MANEQVQLKAHYTVKKLVDEKRTMSIPIFQRLFVWEEEQTRQLLEDLKKSMEKNKELPYFIGVITVQKEESSDKQWKLIDGQQRLSFLTLLGAELGWDDFVFVDTEGADKKQLRINYVGREKDEEDINHLAAKQYDQVANVNFRRFHSVYQEFAARQNDAKDAFSSYVQEQCAFLVNELPANYTAFDLNLFFEKMNSTGRQLTPVEVIKGKYFAKYANAWNACMNFDEKFTDKQQVTDGQVTITLDEVWNSTENIELTADEMKEARVPVKRLVMRPEVLLLHVLKLTATDVTISFDYTKLVQTFKENESILNTKKQVFMDNLKSYRAWMDENVIYLNPREQGYEYIFRREDDINLDGSDLRKLKQFQAMLYVSSGEGQEWVLKAYEECKKANKSTLTLEQLRKQDMERHCVIPSYETMRYGQIDRYWFWALDYLLWELLEDKSRFEGMEKLTPEDQEAIKAYRFRTNRSIEHLHPQNPPAGQDSIEWLNDRNSGHDHVRNSFGNLAMISASFNSSQGNDSVGVKFARVKDNQLPNKNLESIKLLLMFRAAGGEKNEKWTPDLAKTHGTAMYELLTAHYSKKE